MSSTLQDSSHESDNGVVVKDSGDDSDTSTDETGSDSDDEPPGRRAKRQPQVEQSPVQIFTAQSKHQWATYLSCKYEEELFQNTAHPLNDNYFTSAELAENLLGVQTTLVGTIRQNKKEIPRELQPNAQRPEQSSIFCFDR
ncbi:unnamed protein product [Adineta ricciae]|uniref:PiggyBac transposable element-derived protein domain-containing protein n=1 Tax=Adineta ricciae TaxID=249248 RepID=A0A815VT89_ADIRI|nr:unnamed protein product [Adineta ricciae]CAF1532217.1 unnamed protein product [Adineta ricciae]